MVLPGRIVLRVQSKASAMTETPLPSFNELRRQYRPLDDEVLVEDEPTIVPLSTVLDRADDPLSIIAYLNGLGITVATLAELHDAINGLQDEEDLAAHRCQEGVAVVIASDNTWVLFQP
jgi:hypothetical protein